MQEQLAAFTDAGAIVLAVTADRPQLFDTPEEPFSFNFPVLVDEGLLTATAYGLAYAVTPELSGEYKQLGLDIAERNRQLEPGLLVPATYLIDRQGVVRYAHLNVDHMRRPEPTELLAEVSKLNAP